MEREIDLKKPKLETKPTKGTIKNVPIHGIKRLYNISNKDMIIRSMSLTQDLFNINAVEYQASTEETPLPALNTESGTQEENQSLKMIQTNRGPETIHHR